MDSIDFLILSLSCIGLVLLVSILVDTGGGRDTGRHPTAGWKKFSIRPGALFDGTGRGPLVSSADKSRGDLEVLSGGRGSFPIQIGDRRNGALVVIEKPRLSFRPGLRVSLLGIPWLQLQQNGRNGLPRLVGAGRRLPEEVPEAGTIELVGELASREYEIRLRDKLAAAVFLDDEEGAEADGDGSYRVALPENIAELPLLALVLGIEVELASSSEAVRA